MVRPGRARRTRRPAQHCSGRGAVTRFGVLRCPHTADTQEITMRTRVSIMTVVLAVLLISAKAHAQGSITGAVKDASGAVLPGVTVEASSPALIEKVRTAVT